VPADGAEERERAGDRARRVLWRVVHRLQLVPGDLAGVPAGARSIEGRWLSSAEARRLTFVNRRGERVEQIHRLSKIVLVWPMLATGLSVLWLLLARNVLGVLLVLTALYGFGAYHRRPPPRSRVAESAGHLQARWKRRRWIASVSVLVLFGYLAVVVHAWSPVVAQLGGFAVLIGHGVYRYAAWRLDLIVLSTSAIWRFQGLLDFRVSSLEYSKISAGPNATSGLGTWFPVGMIEMDSAAQTGDIPMQRIGPVWGAEDLAVSIFTARKGIGQRVRILNVDEITRAMNE
jgi:hypothetical protein